MNVQSNNGTIHLAEKRTKRQADKKTLLPRLGKTIDGYVRKLCDGQWVPESRRTNASVTCPTCNKL